MSVWACGTLALVLETRYFKDFQQEVERSLAIVFLTIRSRKFTDTTAEKKVKTLL